MSNKFITALANADRAALALGQLAEAIERHETEPARRGALIHITVSAGEFRDRLASLTLDLQRAGVIDAR